MKKKVKPSPQNPVAKFANAFNQSAVFTDRKQAVKKGYIKHKNSFRDQGDAIAA